MENLSQISIDKREIKLLVRAMRNNITDYIIEYSKKHPNITFKTVFDHEVTDYENYDISIDEATDTYHGYDKFELFNMHLRMKVSENSSLLRKKLTLKQLSAKPFISLDEKSNMHKILIRACEKAGFYPNIVAQINDIKCYEKMIASEMGIGIGRENISQESDEKIRYLDVADFNERYVVFAYFKDEAAYGNVRKFLDFLENSSV